MFCFYRHFESSTFNALTLVIHRTSFHIFCISFFIIVDYKVKVLQLVSLSLFETLNLDPKRL
jgi:hypothetical protein